MGNSILFIELKHLDSPIKHLINQRPLSLYATIIDLIWIFKNVLSTHCGKGSEPMKNNSHESRHSKDL